MKPLQKFHETLKELIDFLNKIPTDVLGLHEERWQPYQPQTSMFGSSDETPLLHCKISDGDFGACGEFHLFADGTIGVKFYTHELFSTQQLSQIALYMDRILEKMQ